MGRNNGTDCDAHMASSSGKPYHVNQRRSCILKPDSESVWVQCSCAACCAADEKFRVERSLTVVHCPKLEHLVGDRRGCLAPTVDLG